MRAAVLYEQGKPLVVEDEIEIDPPRAGEVLVRMVASGVCHSCLHAADGSWKGYPMPIVLGDEGSGVVEQVGPGVTRVSPGDHVILSFAPFCGRCHTCVRGRTNICDSRPTAIGRTFDGTTRMRLRGQPVYHYGYVATYGSLSVVHESSAVPIRKDMPLDKAALIGCSVTTGVGAVLNTANVPAGASLAVFGVGGVGLNVVQGGVIAAAEPLIAVDVLDGKLEWARQLGATHTVNAAREDPVEAIRRITGRGVEYAMVAVGSVQAMEQAWDALGRGGTCVIIGAPETGARLTLDANALPRPEKVLTGCYYGSSRPQYDFPRFVDFYLSGRLKLDELITRRYSLEEANEGFRALAAGEVARGLIVH